VATFLALVMEEKVANVEQRLYEWCLDAGDKAGKRRVGLDIRECFAPLLRWIVRLWSGTSLALAVDATSLGDRFVVLTASVVYRGGAIPVAWTVLCANEKHAWRREWLRMLRPLRPAMPPDWKVLVLADRGLYARWLFRRIVRLGWHPFLRINQQGKFRPSGQRQWLPLRTLVSQVGDAWRGAGTAFVSTGSRLECTLVAWWGDGHDEPWFILTDLAADGCDAQWYGLRTWCEQGFKTLKRGAWQWQHTQMSDPARVARLWLALALATFWMLALGTELELGPSPDFPDAPDVSAILALSSAKPPRRIRLLKLGWLWLIVQAIHARPLPLPRRLVPSPWPEIRPLPLLL
jgi:hypothetical protein